MQIRITESLTSNWVEPKINFFKDEIECNQLFQIDQIVTNGLISTLTVTIPETYKEIMAGTYQIAITVGIDTKYTDFLVKERSAFNLETTGKMQIGKGTGVDNQITLTANGYNGANLLNISTSNLTLKNGTGTDASAYVSIVLAPPTNDQAMFTLTLTNNALPDTITAELNYENFTSITTFVIQKVDATKFYNFEIQSNNLQVDNVDSTAVIKITAVNDAPISEMSFSVSTALISGQFSDATDQNVILTLTETTSLVSNDPIHITIIGSDNTELEFDLSIAPARKLQAIVQTNSLQVGNTTSDATVKVQTINYLTTTTINNFTITGATGLTTQMTVSGDYFLLTLGATSSNLTAGNKTITISDNRQSNISTTCLLDVAPFDTTPIIGRNYIDGHQTIDGSHVYTNATSGGVWSATGTGNGVTFTNGTLNWTNVATIGIHTITITYTVSTIGMVATMIVTLNIIPLTTPIISGPPSTSMYGGLDGNVLTFNNTNPATDRYGIWKLSGDTHDDNGDITIYNQNQNTMQILVPGTINKTKNFNLSITFSYSEYETTTVQTTIVMQESLSAPYSISYVNNSAIPETATTDGIHFGMTIGSTCSVKYNTIGDQTFTTGTWAWLPDSTAVTATLQSNQGVVTLELTAVRMAGEFHGKLRYWYSGYFYVYFDIYVTVVP